MEGIVIWVTKSTGRSALLQAALTLVVLVLAVLAVSGCGDPPTATTVAAEQVTLQLNWFHEPEFVGYYVADSKGFYADEGLDVDIVEGGTAVPGWQSLFDGRADFAVSSFEEQQTLVSEERPTVALLSAFQIPPLVMFALEESGIREPKDMAGRTIGIKNEYWRKIARQTLANAGVDPGTVKEVDVKADQMSLLFDKEVDVWMGYAHAEPIEAQVAGHRVTNIYAADYGVGGYEGLLLTQQATIQDKADMVARFVRASQKGWVYAVQHPDEAAAVMTEWRSAGLEFEKLAVRALVPLVDVPQADLGWIDPERWRQLMGEAYDADRPGYTSRFLGDQP
jgi:ABC-type nitrate/sulfonate/bicarbonate transport system substrate-binding protein